MYPTTFIIFSETFFLGFEREAFDVLTALKQYITKYAPPSKIKECEKILAGSLFTSGKIRAINKTLDDDIIEIEMIQQIYSA